MNVLIENMTTMNMLIENLKTMNIQPKELDDTLVKRVKHFLNQLWMNWNSKYSHYSSLIVS